MLQLEPELIEGGNGIFDVVADGKDDLLEVRSIAVSRTSRGHRRAPCDGQPDRVDATGA